MPVEVFPSEEQAPPHPALTPWVSMLITMAPPMGLRGQNHRTLF